MTKEKTPGAEPKRHRSKLKWLILMAVIVLLFGSCVHKWPHYKASAPGGYVTETLMFMRLTWGEQVHLPLEEGAELAARAICYPPEPNGYQGCHVIIDLLIQKPMTVSFTEGSFIARHPVNHEIRFGFGRYSGYSGNCPPSKFDGRFWCVTKKATVYLNYETPPRQFELLIPGVTIGEEHIDVPPIKFEYDDFLAYQFVPWIVNF